MSSVSMALNGLGVEINGAFAPTSSQHWRCSQRRRVPAAGPSRVGVLHFLLDVLLLLLVSLCATGQASNPGTLNAWLEANNGYMCAGGDCNNLILDMPGKVPGSPLSLVGENPKQPASVIIDGILSQSFIYVGACSLWQLAAPATAAGRGG